MKGHNKIAKLKQLGQRFEQLFQKGFTLVELMVVVAIIGILSSVAIPNFKKYQAKSRSSEAKLQLSALYSAETSIFAEFGTYVTCLKGAGYDPSPEFGSRYYAVGFAADVAAANSGAVANGMTSAECTTGAVSDSAAAAAAGTYRFGSGKTIASTRASAASFLLSDAVVPTAGTVFTAGAVGVVHPDFLTATNADAWTINENKRVYQSRQGF